MSADRADEIALVMPPLRAELQERIRDFLPATADAEVRNPLDLTAQSMEHPHALADIAELMLAEPTIDAVVAAFPSGGGPGSGERGRRLAAVAAGSDKPLLSVILSGSEAGELRSALRDGGVPVFSSPAKAVDTIERLHRFAAARPGRPAAATNAAPPDVSSEFAALRWLGEQGLPVVEQRLAASAQDTATAAAELGFPVAVKISSPDIVHKTEVGGVALGVTTPDGARAAFDSVTAAARSAVPSARIDGVTVSPMITPALELIAGVHRDPTFGPMLLLGLGGVWAEVLGDVALRGGPVHGDDAGRTVEQMVDELRGAALLRGARGLPPVKAEALSALISTLSEIAEACGPRLTSLDLNPIAVTADGGLTVLDAAVFVDGTSR